MSLLDYIKSQTPPSIRRLSRSVKQRARELGNRHRTPREVFTDVYATNHWGVGVPSVGSTEFFSGPGSGIEAAQPYAEFVRSFIAEHQIGSVVDLGCGDFRVGQLIVGPHLKYTGVDIVEPLVDANNRRFRSDSVSFKAMDIIEDDLPDGELCLIREVLQHLSNAQIKAILAKVRKYKFVLITDIQPGPIGSFKCNKEKAHGSGSRITFHSALCLDRPPFSIQGVELVMETMAPYVEGFSPYGRCSLRTFLIRHPTGPGANGLLS